MNILIPHTWLLEHLETDATPLEIQKYVSLCGPSIERIYDREGEVVYDIEVTTNRVDSMSVRGIAREAAVILPQFGKKAHLKPLELKKIPPIVSGRPPLLALPTILDDEHLCKRTMCVALAGADRNQTPEWMAKRLRQIDISVHDAVIDITNYITHELGHPCHAFDYDQIMKFGGMIIIKKAAKGKKFTTLDGSVYTTVGGEVVFESRHGDIIDLPGIKGTANTAIQSTTKNVLFWIENSEAKNIRFASMTHAIRTVAAQLNEKNVDAHLALPVLQRGVELFQELTSAVVASKVYDHFPENKKSRPVEVRVDMITEYLGIELTINHIAKILEDLECGVELRSSKAIKGKGAQTPAYFVVTPPSFRPDITIAADVIEEIARIYGYHNLPSILMPTAIPITKQANVNFHSEDSIKHFLADIGWQELYTYSMVSEQIAKKSGYAVDGHLKIQNPLSDDRVYMRRTLIPSLEESIAGNSHLKNLQFFEIANVYDPEKNSVPNEHLQLAMVSTLPYREVKGSLEALLHHFYIPGISFDVDEVPQKMFSHSARITSHHHDICELGIIGVLPTKHTAIVIEMRTLIQRIQTHPAYEPIPRTSEIIEDLTFTFPEKTQIGQVVGYVPSLSPLIRTVTLKDVYGQNMTLTITYNDLERNLDVTEIEPIRRKIVEGIQHTWSGVLVGSI